VTVLSPAKKATFLMIAIFIINYICLCQLCALARHLYNSNRKPPLAGTFVPPIIQMFSGRRQFVWSLIHGMGGCTSAKGETRHGTNSSSAVPWQADGLKAIGGGFFFSLEFQRGDQ
jgi:hypothetical protein